MGIVKQVLFYLPVIGFIVWQIVSLNRDPELRQPRTGEDGDRERASERGDDSRDARHTERE